MLSSFCLKSSILIDFEGFWVQSPFTVKGELKIFNQAINQQKISNIAVIVQLKYI